MEHGQTVTFFVAFFAGLLTFLSPCVFPLIPSYIFYISGCTMEHLSDKSQKRRVRADMLMNSALFVAGFSIVFCALGATASFIGDLFFKYQNYIMKGGAVLIILFGVHMTGVLNFGFMQKEKRFRIRNRGLGYFESVLIGMAFGAGWTPCVGPILGSILVLAGQTKTVIKGTLLLATYSLGVGIPFMVASLVLNQFISVMNKFKRWLKVLTIVSGAFLIIVGVLLFMNQFSRISEWLTVFTTK